MWMQLTTSQSGGGGNRTRVRKRSTGESTYISGSNLSHVRREGTCNFTGTPARWVHPDRPGQSTGAILHKVVALGKTYRRILRRT